MGSQALNGKGTGSKTYLNLGLVERGNGVSDPPEILSVLSSVLERSIQKNEKLMRISRMKDVITIFHGSKVPDLSIRQYIERIFKYTICSPSCFVVAYIYMERVLQQMNGYLTSLNVHRLLITGFMLAAKFIDDLCHNNAYYAQVGGISTAEINRMEMKFLDSLDFRLHVTVETFDKFCLQLEEEAAGKCHIQRTVRIWGQRKGY
ncbi:unnamed protein product [Ilex paraguariensis]|uniref:Cyclin n=1 Tax=Ilex paraguariensis TaxID=185542 RepID=A0ABC8TG89_9AQUA